jgi:hypothetical protein
MKLWIFGQSMCLPQGTESHQGWGWLLSQWLDAEYNNFAQPGADNLFIYHTFLENLPSITSDDLVVIGWSHPNRKSFVLDHDNPAHQDALPFSLEYRTSDHTFFRSFNSSSSTLDKWLTLRPQQTGSKFYDVWFKNYYSDYEQRCNFQSYLDSVQLRAPTQYIPFYFSQESTNEITRQNDNFMLEFIIKNKVAISKDDFHMNSLGHQMWAEYLLEQIQR